MHSSRLLLSRDSVSAEDTRDLGALVATVARPGLLIGLNGELGTGKTEFVRGFMSALSDNAEVSSPSYVLENVYMLEDHQGLLAEIYHWDLYRLGQNASVSELLEIRSHPHALGIVEWVEYSPELTNLLSIEILISFSGFANTGESVIPGASVSTKRNFEFRVPQVHESWGAELYSSLELALRA